MKKTLSLGMMIAAGIVVLAGVPIAYAATTANSTLTQAITAGVLSTSVRDSSGNVVASPSFAMSGVQASNSQQTATGTFGSSTQRITVDNPGGANNGWTLALNATTPGTGTWTNGTQTYAYNGTTATGQLTVNPTAGTLTAVTGGSTGVTLGTSASFSGTTPITLMQASSSASQIWNGYVTGIGLSQTIPASQAVGSYSISMTQTVTAS